MIVTTDVGNILYRDCKAFGIDIVPAGETLTGELKSERIVIHTKKQQPETYWKKSFAEVNICVPNLSENEANSIRLNELERQVNKLFDDIVSSYDGTTYRYSIESIGTEADTALKCHYVNVRILFVFYNMILYDIKYYRIILYYSVLCNLSTMKNTIMLCKYSQMLCKMSIFAQPKI